MHKIILSLFITILTFNISPAHADIVKAQQAYEKGDYKTALKEYDLSARKNQPFAQFKLARMYDQGLGTPRNIEEAIKLYKKAAYNLHAEAYLWLGHKYRDGDGVELNYGESFNNYMAAAKKNILEAKHEMAALYEDEKIEQSSDTEYQIATLFHIGAKTNSPELDTAIYWYRKAAANDHKRAQMALKRMKLD